MATRPIRLVMLVELLDDLVGSGDGEIVGRAGGQAADAPHRALHFVVGFLALARLGLGGDHEAVDLRIARFARCAAA